MEKKEGALFQLKNMNQRCNLSPISDKNLANMRFFELPKWQKTDRLFKLLIKPNYIMKTKMYSKVWPASTFR